MICSALPETCMPQPLTAYLRKRSTPGPWELNEAPECSFSSAIVIPALAEAANLPQTLESLSRNSADLLNRTMILIVVNQRCDATGAETADNLQTLRMLPFWKRQFGLSSLFWIDAASSGKELPAKQGVGLARKLGLDLATLYLDYKNNNDPLLICLDADTVVQTDYLSAITRHFSGSSAGGASIAYRHRPAPDPAGQAAIDRYELFLRAYVLGLKLADSPYAFHTVGSAMACRTSAYVASGGMNRRLAGEDFYFLQQVHKTSGVAQLNGTVVQPSSRSSHRVPFGTGRSVGDMLTEGEQRLLFYQPVVFEIVGAWLAYVGENSGEDASFLLKGATLIAPVLNNFLEQAGFADSWENMKKHNRDGAKLMTAFHGWFDAFRTMRLIHELSEQAYPRSTPLAAVAPLLVRAGLSPSDSIGGQLDLLRSEQGIDAGIWGND